RKTPSQDFDDFRCVVQRKRRLRDVGDLARVAQFHSLRILYCLYELNSIGELPQGTFDLRVADVADEQYLVIETVQPQDLPVDLGNQRASGIDRPQRATLGFGLDSPRNAMSGEDGRRALWYLIRIFYEDSSL